MNSLSPIEIVQNYAKTGKKKAERSHGKMILLSILAGLLISFGGAVTNTAVHTISNVSVARIICGLLFPFGLAMVMLLGAELFTGNCMIIISLLEKETNICRMLMNWILVYCGNFVGAILLAVGCAYFGQMDYSAGALAVYTIKVAAGKCTLSFTAGIVLGFFCNILVCGGVLCSLTAKDTTGRILGAYIPVAFFVICGFEHCVANMYYISAGLFAVNIPEYAQLVKQAGIDTSMLTWGNFLGGNLLPVTIGNILGGVALAVIMWAGHLYEWGHDYYEKQRKSIN
ncbi:MAG: formate/nitrite transporter family protein [Lachnospiraceae bacterium]